MSAAQPTVAHARRTHRPVLEQLEDRTLLSGNPLPRDVTVMSRNLYLGGDVYPAIAAVATGNPGVFIPAVSHLWATVKTTNLPERARVLADEIHHYHPAMVVLQEADLRRIGLALNP